MASNPRILTADVNVTWDGVTTSVQRGTIVDIPAGGALEAAYGSSNLVSLAATSSQVSSGDTEPVNVGSG
jgi:hypothetical protein